MFSSRKHLNTMMFCFLQGLPGMPGPKGESGKKVGIHNFSLSPWLNLQPLYIYIYSSIQVDNTLRHDKTRKNFNIITHCGQAHLISQYEIMPHVSTDQRVCAGYQHVTSIMTSGLLQGEPGDPGVAGPIGNSGKQVSGIMNRKRLASDALVQFGFFLTC